jgi:peptidoglycan/LPS O-acetylase OafA/YrhL
MGTSRIESLDGLRAAAASLIVVFHLGLANFAAGLVAGGHAHLGAFLSRFGASGVELFFTLSAVVLLRPYLRSGRRMDAGAYAWRRVKRLWPPFLGAWLLAGFAVAMISAYPTWWPSAMPAFSLGGWFSQIFIAYAGHSAYNFAWWTLTIEVGFYVLAPLLVLLLAKRSAVAMWAVFAGSIGASLVAGEFALAGESSLSVARFLSFASCFAGGLVLARQDVGASMRALLAGLGACIVGAAAFDPRANSHVGYGLLYMAVVSQAMSAGSLSRWLTRPVMIWLGERSYSLFLTHYSVIALACWATSFEVAGKSAAFFIISRALAVVGSLVAACVLFELVESRFAHGLVTAGMWWPGRRRVGAISLPGTALG